MSFSSGTFSLITGNPVVTDTTISSTTFNNTMIDIATGLSTALLKDGTQTATAVIPFVLGITVPTSAAGNTYSGTYTPTITNGTNVASAQTRLCGYKRVGNEVTVEGQFDIDPTATGATNWTISVPVATNFAVTTTGCGGSGASSANASVYLEPEPVTDTITFSMVATSSANQTISFCLMYRVI